MGGIIIMEKNTKKWIGILAAIVLLLLGFYLYYFYPQFISGMAGKNPTINRDVNILLFGLDDMNSVKEGEIQADSIAVINYSSEEKILKITALSPEMNLNGKKLKNYSAEVALNDFSELNDIKLDYYFSINYNGFIKVIDELGGIKINVAEKMEIPDLGLNLEKGDNLLSGREALNYARWYGYDDNKVDRIKRQQFLMEAIIKKVFNRETMFDISKLYSTIVESYKMVDTNMDPKLVSNLVKFAQNNSNIKIEYNIIHEK